MSRFTICPKQVFRVSMYKILKNKTNKDKWQKQYAGSFKGVWEKYADVVARSPVEACWIIRMNKIRIGLYHKLRAEPTWIEVDKNAKVGIVKSQKKGK